MDETEIIRLRVPGEPTPGGVSDVGIIGAVDRSYPGDRIAALAAGIETLIDHATPLIAPYSWLLVETRPALLFLGVNSLRRHGHNKCP